MPQVTLYLDDETEALLARASAAAGLSKSRWAAQVIRRHAGDAWPDECRALAGAFPDFPLVDREAGTQAEVPDAPRIGF